MPDNNNKKLSQDVLAYIPVKLIPAITGLLSIVILTRNLEPEAYGRYSVVIATVLLFVQLASAWLSNSILYYYPEYKGEKDRSEFRYQILKMQFYICIVAMVVVYVAVFQITRLNKLALLGSVLLFGQVFFGILLTFHQSSRLIHVQSIGVGVQSVSQILMLTALVFLVGGKEISAVIALASGYYCGIGVLLIVNRKNSDGQRHANKKISRTMFFDILGYGMPMCLWFFATQFYSIGDRLFLQYFNVDEKLGQYTSFRDLAMGCAGFLTMPLLMASHPIIMSKWKNNSPKIEIETIIQNNIEILTLLFAPVFILTHFIGRNVIMAVLTEKYLLDVEIMILIVISIYLGSVTIYLQKGLEVTGSTVLMAKLSILTALVSLILNFSILPKFGVLGGAFVTLFSGFFYLTIVLISIRKILLPCFSFKFWLTIVLWVMLSEVMMCFVNSIISDVLSFNYIFSVNAIIIFIFTTILYAIDGRFNKFFKYLLNKNANN